jgi:hypothetical protein
LSRTLGPKRDKIRGECRKLHKELNDLYSPNISRVIKSRRKRWTGHVGNMGEGKYIQGFGGET